MTDVESAPTCMVLTGLLSRGSAARSETFGRFEIPRTWKWPGIVGIVAGVIAQHPFGFLLWDPVLRVPGLKLVGAFPFAGWIAYPILFAAVAIVMVTWRTRSGASAAQALRHRMAARGELGRLHLGVYPTEPEPVRVNYQVAAVRVDHQGAPRMGL